MTTLSTKQYQAIKEMQKYPNDMLMWNGFMTGGHGVFVQKRTVKSLEARGLVKNGKLTKEGYQIK